MARRREERVNLVVPVRIWGLDARGKAFTQEARTIDITRLGARLSGVAVAISVGDIIGVQHGKEKARFRVTWVGAPGTAEGGQLGIHCVEPTKFIWGVTPLEPPAEEPEARPMEPMTVAADGRRIHSRFACEGTAELRPRGGSSALWATVCDISLSGCYLETLSPLPMGTVVELLLRIEDIEVHTPAMVRTSHPAVGMGTAFTETSAVDRDRIERVIARLEAKASGTVPAAPPPATQVTELSRRLQAASTELKDLEQVLHSGDPEIDSRVLRDFRSAVDHARQIAWMVQEWLQLSAQHRDPFAILPQLEEEQVRFLAQLTKDVEMEIEATDIDVGTHGVVDMQRAVEHLHRRLAQLLEKQEAAPPAEPAALRRTG